MSFRCSREQDSVKMYPNCLFYVEATYYFVGTANLQLQVRDLLNPVEGASTPKTAKCFAFRSMHRSFSHSHSAVRGESECEDLANRIERRRAERITITFDVRVALVKRKWEKINTCISNL